MGIPANVIACAEKKPHAQAYCKQYYKAKLGHLFCANNYLIEGRGVCVLHGKETCAVSIPSTGLQCASGGLPCQPFTSHRYTGGLTPRTGRPEQHPAYDEVFDTFIEFLEGQRPSQWWVEEVKAFMTHMHKFATLCAAKGYAVRGVLVDHNTFCESARARLQLV